MPITPYTPTPFATPVANAAVGGTGVPYPYVSASQYQNAPTAMDVSNLVPGGSVADQTQALADVLARASAWADRICFGADPASKQASLCATLSVETAQVPLIRGELRLICDYKPIVQVNGVDVGADMATLSSVGPDVASRIRVGRRTLYVPLLAIPVRSGNANITWPPGYSAMGGSRMTAVWAYVNGYPHTQLAANIAAGATTCSVLATDGGTGLLGIIPNVTQLTIVNGIYTERFTVQSVAGTTLTSTTPFQYAHTFPAAPDFLAVTAVPRDVEEAVILLATVLIKTQGDNSLVLQGVSEPRGPQPTSGGSDTDYERACKLLAPFRVHVKSKN